VSNVENPVSFREPFESITKRDGSVVPFSTSKISNAIFKAAKSIGGSDRALADELGGLVVEYLSSFNDSKNVTVEQIHDACERILIKEGHVKTAKSYILYRQKQLELKKEISKTDSGSDELAILKMFAHKSKILNLVSYDIVDTYKKLLFHLKSKQKSGDIPVSEDYLSGNELALNIYSKKYYLKSMDGANIESKPEDVFARVAAFLASVEKDPSSRRAWAEQFYNCLYKGYFLPGGRVLTGAGDLYRLKTLANCFVSKISEDTIEGIYDAAYEAARTYSYGGGMGIDISCLRPANSRVHNAANFSTGAVSFMELYSLTTGLIGQSGRRGALMLTLDVKHPDAFLFCNVKNNPNWVTKQIVEQAGWSGSFDESQLKKMEGVVAENTQVRFANISFKVNDEFMQSVDEFNTFGGDKIVVYEKDKEVVSSNFLQGSVHYSEGIPSRPLNKYAFVNSFDTVSDLNVFLNSKNCSSVSEDQLNDVKKRDAFGDFLVKGSGKDFAVHYSGDFMLYFNSKEAGEIKNLIKSRDLWNAFVEGNYKGAEPGLIFWSSMSKYSPSNYVGKPIVTTNPCGEVPLEDGGACNLGSINLSRFVKNGYEPDAAVNWDELEYAVSCLTRLLDNTVSWNESLNALGKQRNAASDTRRVGLGVMGVADMLNQLGLDYDSSESVKLMEDVTKFIANVSYQSSANIASEKGSCPSFNYSSYKQNPFFQEVLDDETKEVIRDKGLRNIAILSIAPTGTLSNVVLGFNEGDKNYIGVSSGIEPIFSLYYTRRSESFGNQLFKVFHSTVNAYIDKNDLRDKVDACDSIDDLRKVLPDNFFRTAHFIDPFKRIEIQGIVQKYIDHSISSTVNLSEDISPERLSEIYMYAWRNGLKGVTIYRDGSRFPILSVEGEKTKFQDFKDKKFTVTLDGKDSVVNGDSIIVLSDGRLSTPYHLMNEGSSIVKEYSGETSNKEGVSIEVEETTPLQKEVSSSKSSLISEGVNLVECPSCKDQSLKIENGCKNCINEKCGYGQCDV